MSKQKPIYKLEVFSGPLDLLLHLIAKNKVSIYDIPISMIFEQYMQYIEDLKKMDLELSSEFIEMAATLMYIKSKMLLPSPADELEDPREQLALALIEYRRYKTILPIFAELNKRAGITYVRQTEYISFDKTHKLSYPIELLEKTYKTIVLRNEQLAMPAEKAFKGIVSRRITSVPVKIVSILRTLKKNTRASLLSLFKKARTRSDIVATFLAILELSKARRVTIEDTGGELFLSVNDRPEQIEKQSD